MKRVLFLASHLCSGSDALFRSLSAHPRIEGYRTNSAYETVPDLLKLTSLPHKLGNASAVYMDEVLLNHAISSKSLYRDCHYVFLIRPPRETLNEIAYTKDYSFASATSHYLMRLRRLCTIAKHATRSVFLTSDDLESGTGGDLIADMLHLKEPVEIERPVWKMTEDAVPQKYLLECDRAYDRARELMRTFCPSAGSCGPTRSSN